MTEIDKAYRNLYEKLCKLEDWELEDNVDALKVMAYDEIVKVIDIDAMPEKAQKIMIKIAGMELR